MLERILVAVDGSQPSMRAVELASDLAWRYGAEVILLHVLLRGHMPEGLKRALEVEVAGRKGPASGDLVNLPPEIMARVDDRKQTQLTLGELEFIGKHVLSRALQVCKDKGLKSVTQRVEEGHPAELILDVAKKSKADHIVIGSRGLGRLGEMLMGGVSSKVVHLAECPCTVVK